MSAIKFTASLWKVSRDHDNEVTLILKVPETDFIRLSHFPLKHL